MSKKNVAESESYTIVFENMDELDTQVSQAEISLVIKYFSGIHDDRVRPARQKQEDLP